MPYRCQAPSTRRCVVCGRPYERRAPAGSKDSGACSPRCRLVRVHLRVWLAHHRTEGLQRDRAKARLMGLMNHLWASLL